MPCPHACPFGALMSKPCSHLKKSIKVIRHTTQRVTLILECPRRIACPRRVGHGYGNLQACWCFINNLHIFPHDLHQISASITILKESLIAFTVLGNSKQANAYQKANVTADKVITVYTNGPAIVSTSRCIGASWP